MTDSLLLLQQKKTDKIKELYEMQKKIFEIEKDIIDIDIMLSSFSDNIILENLKLSPIQQEIVNAKDNYILVVACPGSGKTHTLIARYIRLVTEKEILPSDTLLITFTKKAGMEMLHRLNNIIPNKIPKYVGSLHGLAYKILQEYMDINFSVLDEKDVNTYFKDLLDDTIVAKHFENYDINDINSIKTKLQMFYDIACTSYPFDIKNVLKKHNMEKFTKEFNYIYKMYMMKKKRENIVDFNDLMIMFSKFLDSSASSKFLDSISYVFFDEYQDVNMIQNYILKKFANKSKIMVVGDDAQSIYSFRGSSVNYILNFDKEFPNNKMTLLEENYRSTPYIVNFCQDIISHNMYQYPKSVVSTQDKNGVMPAVYAFKSYEEQYKWVVSDIHQKIASGVTPSDIVVLARKNNLLNDIELHFIGAKINVSKNIGSSLLDRSHVKDFLAWVSIMINPKSSIHWKRIISMYPGYGIKKANNILDNNAITIIKAIEQYITKEPNSILTELVSSYYTIKKIKNNHMMGTSILHIVQKLWIQKKENNIDMKVMDICNLLQFLKNTTLDQFINDLYLNQDIETNMDNMIYLTTIHGAKGLEWDHVYLIDMDSSNFPSNRPKYYLDELGDVDEERRLFYVAASRAKKFLHITMHENTITRMSPLLRELNTDNYSKCGVNMDNISLKNGISKDITNYLKFIGYSNISEQLSSLNNNRSYINKMLNIPSEIEKLESKIIIGNFMDYLISKMLQCNFPKKVKKFDLPLIHKHPNFPQKIYLEYIDMKTDWRNILEHIFYISCYKMNNCNDEEKELYKNFLISQESFNYYLEMEKGLCKLINNLKPKDIYTHYNVTMGDVCGEIDILCDNNIIEVKCTLSNMNEIATVPYIGQVLLYAYLLKRKGIVPKDMILYNPLNGEINQFDISAFDLSKFKNTIYK
jgi:DNA helicase-2/ATP-dependent DNA helicase PcrA